MNNKKTNSNMKIYILNGYDLNPSEWQRYSVALVFKTREEAEAKIQQYANDAAFVLKSCLDGDRTQYTECLNKHNGHIARYTANVIYDMADKKQREAYMQTISSGWLSEEGYAWPSSIETHTRELRLIDLSIKEIEL